MKFIADLHIHSHYSRSCSPELIPENLWRWGQLKGLRVIGTGLSSDPPMNWRLSQLDRITLISNSDAHSLSRLGREANIFETGLSYRSIMEAIKTGSGFAGTIEFFPEEGKYHLDGHRSCGIRFDPKETIDHGFLCPVCGKRVTIGVLHRTAKLADLPEGRKPVNAPPFRSVVPLMEILAETLRMGLTGKKAERVYFDLLEKLGNELTILLDTPVEEIAGAGYHLPAEAIRRMRAGEVHITPGFDGIFGKVSLSGTNWPFSPEA